MDDSDFPFLAHLIGAYFHQDYSIDGPEMEDVVDAYVKVSSPASLSGLVADIDRFLAIEDPTLDDLFVRIFEPGIIANEFRPTTREFLLAIRDRVQSSPKSAP